MGKSKKIDAQCFELDLVENILLLHFDLENKIYHHGNYTAFYVHDPKLRHIHKASVRDRVLHHAITKILMPLFEPVFIFDSYSSRKNKGTHRAVLRLKQLAWKLSANGNKIVWALKCDVRKFFDSVDHQILLEIIAGKIVDVDLMWLIKEIVSSFPSENPSRGKPRERERAIGSAARGIPLGNLTSQLFSNIYLNSLDQFVKRGLREKCYVRYADDFVILSRDREHLEKLIPILVDYLDNKLKLTLHPDKIILRKFRQGVDFLGYVVFPHHIILRQKTKQRIIRKIKKNCEMFGDGLIAPETFAQTVQSYLGILRHCRGYGIRKEIFKIIAEFGYK
ncbi:MAG TPA: reverse transcriptase/maturase family protein [Patescibacteria group bacterium]|nr:reverse transcriptase/maturase family protein [Patescibacteria group bacterium]